MGLFDGLRGKKDDYPALDPSSLAAARLAAHAERLQDLAKRANDRLEAVPTDDGLFVYIGKPPKQFGVVWYENGEEHSFMSVMKDRGLTNQQIQDLSDELRDVYTTHQEEPRYSFPLGGQKLVVTPAPPLAEDLRRVIGAIGA
ncbi:MAG: hypothetical protein ACYCX3_09955 [Thermoleophilia bacterium]